MILETERLLLREAKMEDAAFFLELLNAPNWLSHIGDRGVRTLESAANYIKTRLMTQYVTYGFGLWVVDEKSTGKSIGICGILRRAGLDDPDIGFAFLPSAEGKGYGYESAAASLRYGHDQLGIHNVLAITTRENARSIQLLERIGLQFQKMILLPGEDSEVMLFATPSTSKS